MSIELKVGEWYETRAGDRVKVIADIRETVPTTTKQRPLVVVYQDGSTMHRKSNGMYYDAIGPLDIVRHLPGCTGWNWVEPAPEKWRDAKPEDAIRQPHLRCRVRSTLSGEWIAGCSLVGYYVSGTIPQWIVNIAGVCGTHDSCQVLDTENE